MIGLLISLLSHSSFLLPLLTHNSYCISCCCSLLAFSSTTAAKPGLSRGSHSCMEGSATAWLSLCSDTASKVQALQELVEPYRKEQVFHLVLLSKSKEHANTYEEEVRSCLVTCYTNWRPVVPVGKRKPKKLSAARSPQIQAVRPCRGQHSPHCMTAVLPDQINPKWHLVLQSILSPAPAMPGTPGEEAQLFFFHSGCINSSFVAFWTRLCSKHPGVALCCLQRCLQLKGAPCGCSAVPLGRQFPAPLTRRRGLCLWNSCGNRTARLPSPAGGSRASRRSRAVPRAAQSHSTACCPPAAPSLPFRVPFTLMFWGG